MPVLYGDSTNNSVAPAGNLDALYGGAGNDTLHGGSSSALYGGAGNDTLDFLDHASTDVSNITAGSNGSMDITFSSGQVTQVSNLEFLTFNDGHTTEL